MMGKLGGRNRWRAISQWNAYYLAGLVASPGYLSSREPGARFC